MSRLLKAQTYKNIIEGWAHYAFPSDTVERLAKNRAAICATCTRAVIGRIIQLKDEKIHEASGLTCEVCGCPLPAKIRATEETCPLKKW